MSPLADLPLDILYPILANVNQARDWCQCALVNKSFNAAATPLLYRNLDARIISKSIVRHPATTILKRPELAQYVHAITESGTLHFRMMQGWSDLTQDVLKVLALCTSLKSLTWSDDSQSRGYALVAFLKALPAPLEELNIRTHNDPAQEVWDEVHKLTGLKKVTIWCMEGPPRVLQGWSERLGPTLTTLELGRCAGVPPTILVAVMMHLPHITSLRLKGASSAAITSVVPLLPKLETLDTEYLPSLGRSRPSPSSVFPQLRSLTIRASSGDYEGPEKLWKWILSLVPGPTPSLEVFNLHSFIMNVMGKGRVMVPGQFVGGLCRLHGETLKAVDMGDAHVLLRDIQALGEMCPKMEILVCGVVIRKLEEVKQAIASASNLRSLTLQADWIYGDGPTTDPFGIENARDWMLRSEDSKLRYISVNDVNYIGQWILDGAEETSEATLSQLAKMTLSHKDEVDWETSEKKENGLKFLVITDLPKDRWYIRFGSFPGMAISV